MKRSLAFGIVSLVALLLLLGVAGFAVQSRSVAAEPVPPHPFPPELQGVPPAERFDHFRSAQFTITDAQGNAVTYQVTPGTVAGVSTTNATTTISVVPNGQTTAMTFNVTPDTYVHARPTQGSLQALAQGDKVIVLARQDSSDAVVVWKHQPRAMFRGMMDGSTTQ